MTAIQEPPVLEDIVAEHAEGTAFLWLLRNLAIRAPHRSLSNLVELDERIDAHMDGLRLAGEFGWKACEAQFGVEDTGIVFSATVLALESKNPRRIETLIALTEAVPSTQAGLISGFGWVSAQFLQGSAKALLELPSPYCRRIGIACCTMHGVDAGQAIEAGIVHADASLRARALRAAGEVGRRDLLNLCERSLDDKDIACRFWAAWSSAVLGGREKSVDALKMLSFAPGLLQKRSLQLVLKVMPLKESHEILKALARDPANARTLIEGAGIVGDPFYVPWLIKQMENPELARLASESFSFITGLDLAYLELDRKPPENFESGANDDPNDNNVAMDADENLPWPDPKKIQAWWSAHEQRFQQGTRYFMGEPVGVEHCRKVLREGYQRQRIAAALYLSFLQPGAPLFPTSAPAWRQQRWLAKMT